MKGFLGGFFPSKFALTIEHGMTAWELWPGPGIVRALVAPEMATAKAFLLNLMSKSCAKA